MPCVPFVFILLRAFIQCQTFTHSQNIFGYATTQLNKYRNLGYCRLKVLNPTWFFSVFFFFYLQICVLKKEYKKEAIVYQESVPE